MTLKLIDPVDYKRHSIAAPIGGFGNHVRWLVFLDPKFKFDLVPFAEPRSLQKELNYEKRLNFLDADSKLECFRSKIYPPERSWENWLKFEWFYRKELDEILKFDHKIDPNCNQCLALTIHPDLAFHCYFKLNSNLNWLTPNEFKHRIKNFMIDSTAGIKAQSSTDKFPDVKILLVNSLYQKTLDRNLYNSIIEWFELSDCYELANQVHGLWFDAHERAQKEFVQYVNKEYTNT